MILCFCEIMLAVFEQPGVVENVPPCDKGVGIRCLPIQNFVWFCDLYTHLALSHWGLFLSQLKILMSQDFLIGKCCLFLKKNRGISASSSAVLNSIIQLWTIQLQHTQACKQNSMGGTVLRVWFQKKKEQITERRFSLRFSAFYVTEQLKKGMKTFKFPFLSINDCSVLSEVNL